MNQTTINEYVDLILNNDIALEAQLKRIKWCIEQAKHLKEEYENNMLKSDDALLQESWINNTLRDTLLIINSAIDRCLVGEEGDW